MSKIPTAKEFWDYACKNEELKSPSDIMIEFAKLHVQEALKAADDNARVEIIDYDESFDGNDTPVYGVNSDSILNAYLLENIK